MSLPVSRRMTRIRPSATGELLGRAKALQAAGRNIINLVAGEPDFDTPEHIRAAGIAAIQRGETRYTPIDGTAALKAAVCAKFRRENGLGYEPENVLISNGAKHSLFNAFVALLEEGRKLIVPAPFWVSYPDMAGIAGAEAIVLPTTLESGFKLTPPQLAEALDDSVAALVLNSPSNPTGASYTAAELRALGEVLEAHPNVVVIADEIYEHIYWADEPFTSFAAACPALFERTLTINGVSKAYAMTGWRIGYAAGPEALIRSMKAVQSQSTSNPCSISQTAALAALEGPLEPVEAMRDAYRQRHDYLVPALNELPGVVCRPGEGTFYAFPRVTEAMQALGLTSDLELAEHLLENAEVAVMPGSPFGAPGHLRFSFAASMTELETAISRVAGALGA